MFKNLKTVALISTLCLTTTLVGASPVGGNKSAKGALVADEIDTYTIVLRGDENWLLTAHGNGDGGDLDCYVFDQDDNLIGKDDDTTNICIISGSAEATAPFKVVLTNNGTRIVGYDVSVR